MSLTATSQEPTVRDRLDLSIRVMVDSHLTLGEAMRTFRLAYLRVALENDGGNQSRAAVHLGIHRNTLRVCLNQMPELRGWLRQFKSTRHWRQTDLGFCRPAKPFSAHDAGVRSEWKTA